MEGDCQFDPWDGDVEINPVIEGGDYCEVWDESFLPDLPSYWSVYVHNQNPAECGAVQCIADFETEDQAEKFGALIESVYSWAKELMLFRVVLLAQESYKITFPDFTEDEVHDVSILVKGLVTANK